jgi:CPA2 family monovalent cation:H+ antiporter-2
MIPATSVGVGSVVANVSPLFALLTLVLVLAVLVSLALIRIRQSLLLGYLLCGVLIGNTGLLRLTGSDQGGPVIHELAEIGVVLLMFTLGIEFSFGELKHLWRTALIGGGLQVVLTSLVAGGAALALGVPGGHSVVLGVAVALSSTAVAMKSFQDAGHQNNPGARAGLGIALFQDILVIIFFLVMPVLYHAGGGNAVSGLGMAFAKGVLFLCGAWVLGRFGITPLLHAVAATRSRELFTLTVVGMCVGVAFAGGALNLSLALGAFAAGLVVSESIYSHRILAEILPFKDLFLALFFISVGLLIDLRVAAAHWPSVLLGSTLILLLKSGVVFFVLRLLRLPARPALLAAASLASTGEFSLVLVSKAGGYRPLDPVLEQMLLACTALTMSVVPVMMRRAIPLARWMEERGLLSVRQTVVPELATPSGRIKQLSDHAIICGYGTVGMALNEALARCGVSTLVVDLNAQTVRRLKAAGQAVLFADATHAEALDLAGLGEARLVAFTFPAVDATCRAVPLLRERNPAILIFGRAKYPAEVMRLRELGVQVIHDEREAAVAMVRSAVASYERNDIDAEKVVLDVTEQGS